MAQVKWVMDPAMEEVKFMLQNKVRGAFYIMVSTEKVAEMIVGVSGNRLNVYHTEFSGMESGNTRAIKLFENMVTYARNHRVKVVPFCAYVLGRFKINPESYADIWEKQDDDE